MSMVPPSNLRCEADSCFQHQHSRCKNLARIRTETGRSLCSRHAGLLAIDMVIKLGRMTYKHPTNEGLFQGYFEKEE